MAANLYAKSIFGEDALANVSLEKNMAKPDAPVTGINITDHWTQLNFLKHKYLLLTGHIRIRAKSQGMALSLGDKINSTQKTR